MSDNNKNIFGPSATSSHTPIKRSPTSRYRWFALIVVVLVIGFAALTWQRWVSPTLVKVVRVEVVQAEGATATTNSVAFQAAGWIEADPYMIAVSALIDGIVSELFVLNGQAVERGTVIAHLVNAERQLAVEMAQSTLTRRQAAAQAAETQIRSAEAEYARLPARIAAVTAELAVKRDRSQRLAALESVVSVGSREQAALEVEAAQQHVADVSGSQAVLLVAIENARAGFDDATAAVKEAQVALADAQLALERTIIRAPQAGIIQNLYIRPGSKLRLAGDHMHSAIAAELYDPTKLQARVDVSLADISQLIIGQQARVSCEALGQRILKGTVTRLDGQADVARNTLQVKIALEQSDPILRPEMLCRVQFLGSADSTVAHNNRVQLLLPINMVSSRQGDACDLWMIDSNNRAQRVTVRLGEQRGAMIEIRDGLSAGAWVIREPPSGLTAGQRVRAQETP